MNALSYHDIHCHNNVAMSRDSCIIRLFLTVVDTNYFVWFTLIVRGLFSQQR